MDDDLAVGTTAPTPAAAPAPLAPGGRWTTFLRRRTDGLPPPFWWLWLGTLVNRAGTFIEPFFVLYLTGPRDVSIRTAGFVLTLWGVGSLLSQPLGGFLTDRFGRRWTLAASLAATAAALASLGVVRNIALIALLGFAVGLVGDMYRPAATAAIADVVADDDRERAYALQFWAINLGFSVASVAAGALLHYGFATLFVLDALTTLAFGLLALRFVPETRPGSTERPARLADPLRVLRADRLLLAATLIMLVYAVLYGQVTVVLPLAITHSGLSASVFGYVVAINGVLIVVLQPLAIGWLAGMSRRRTVPFGLALVGVGLGATTFCDRPWQFALTVVVWTVGEIAVSGSFQATIAALAPEHMRGRYAGALGLAWGASDLLAPVIGTSLYAFSPGFTSACCVAAGAVAAFGQHRLLGSIAARSGKIAV
jgi:predicted MFS family arabinose efflux permease